MRTARTYTDHCRICKNGTSGGKPFCIDHLYSLDYPRHVRTKLRAYSTFIKNSEAQHDVAKFISDWIPPSNVARELGICRNLLERYLASLGVDVKVFSDVHGHRSCKVRLSR